MTAELINSKPSEVENDLYDDMKPLIYFGRATLIFPLGKGDNPLYRNHRIGFNTIIQLLNIFLQLWTWLTLIFEVKGIVETDSGKKLGFMGYVSASRNTLTTTLEALIFLYFLRDSRKFYAIFEKWSYISRKFHLKRDKWLRPLAFGLILWPLLQLGLNCLCHHDILQKLQQKTAVMNGTSVDKIESKSMIRLFYENTLQSSKAIFPYDATFVLIIFLLRLLKSLPWYFLPTLIIFYSRAMAFQYKTLIAEVTDGNVSEAHFVDMKKKDKIFWVNMVRKHQNLSLLVKTINTFLTPLIFCWVALYIYIISMEFFGMLFEEDVSGRSAKISAVLFFVETIQFIVTLVSATKVNTYAMKILNVTRNCPREHYYDSEVCRLEHQITDGPGIAFTGLGCFSITRPFLIKVFNGVFTMEIILLQSAESSPTNKNN